MFVNHSLTADEEVTLASAIARGDQKAFEIFFFRHKDRVYTIAFTYTESHTIAEELVQDVFVRLWKNRHKLVNIKDISSWVYVITRNLSLTALQRIAQEGKRKEEMISYIPAGINDVEKKLQKNYVEELLEKALMRLSPQQRKVFTLSRLEGYSRIEVAEMLNLAPATVSVHLTIALRSIRAFFTSNMELLLLLLFFLRYP